MRNGAPRGADGARGPYIVAVDDDEDARECILDARGRRSVRGKDLPVEVHRLVAMGERAAAPRRVDRRAR